MNCSPLSQPYRSNRSVATEPMSMLVSSSGVAGASSVTISPIPLNKSSRRWNLAGVVRRRRASGGGRPGRRGVDLHRQFRCCRAPGQHGRVLDRRLHAPLRPISALSASDTAPANADSGRTVVIAARDHPPGRHAAPRVVSGEPADRPAHDVVLAERPGGVSRRRRASCPIRSVSSRSKPNHAPIELASAFMPSSTVCVPSAQNPNGVSPHAMSSRFASAIAMSDALRPDCAICDRIVPMATLAPGPSAASQLPASSITHTVAVSVPDGLLPTSSGPSRRAS